MEKQIVSTDKAPAAIGPYSQGARTAALDRRRHRKGTRA